MSDEQERLVRIETKLDMLLADDHDKEERIRKLERRDAWTIGACTIIAFVAPFVAKKLGF